MPYRAKFLRFLAVHWLELSDSGSIPAHLYLEFEHLPPGRICGCQTLQIPAQERLGSGVFESKLPTSATSLDFQVAYAALPMNDKGRTTVWLLMHGTTEEEQYQMSPSLFLAHHRQRIRSELAHPGYQTPKSPATTEVARGSVWSRMAASLNGPGSSQQSAAEPAADLE